MKNDKKVLFILIVGFICIVVTPFIFTKYGFGIDFTTENSNNIGGTIGGITAPIVGLLGAILIYFALKEQVTANYLIQKQLDEQKATDDENKIVTYLKKQLQIIDTDINNLHYTIKSKTTADGIHPEKIYTGSDAIRKYLVALKNSNRDCEMSTFTELYQIDSIKHLLTLIELFVNSLSIEVISDKDKHYLSVEIGYHYITKIKNQFDIFEEWKSTNLPQCSHCHKYHQGIPEEFYELVYNINKGLKL